MHLYLIFILLFILNIANAGKDTQDSSKFSELSASSVSLNMAFLEQLAMAGLTQIDYLDNKSYYVHSIGTFINVKQLRVEPSDGVFAVDSNENAIKLHIKCLKGEVSLRSNARLGVVNLAYALLLPKEIVKEVLYNENEGYRFVFDRCLDFSGYIKVIDGPYESSISVQKLRINSYNGRELRGRRWNLRVLERCVLMAINSLLLKDKLMPKIHDIWALTSDYFTDRLRQTASTFVRSPVVLSPLQPSLVPNALVLSQKTLYSEASYAPIAWLSRLERFDPANTLLESTSYPMANILIGQTHIDDAVALFLALAPQFTEKEIVLKHSRSIKKMKINNAYFPRKSIHVNIIRNHLLVHVSKAKIDIEAEVNWKAKRFQTFWGRINSFFLRVFAEKNNRIRLNLTDLSFTTTLRIVSARYAPTYNGEQKTKQGFYVCKMAGLGGVQRLPFQLKVAHVKTQSFVMPNLQTLREGDFRRRLVNVAVKNLINRIIQVETESFKEKLHYFEHLLNCKLKNAGVDLGGRIIVHRPTLQVSNEDQLKLSWAGFCIDEKNTYDAPGSTRIEHLGFGKEMDTCNAIASEPSESSSSQNSRDSSLSTADSR